MLSNYKLKCILFTIIFVAISTSVFNQIELKKFEYDITIEARILPLFVVDKKGNPVFDLKKSDLILYVNGKKTEIGDLIKYKFDYTAKEKKEVYKTVYKKKVKQIDRMVFIVFDTIFNSRYGIKRMKVIAQKIIETGSENDYFMIIGMEEHRGLYPIYGPAKKGKKLLQIIERQKLFSSGERLRRHEIDIENVPGQQYSNSSSFILLNAFKQKQANLNTFAMLRALDNLKKVIDKVAKPKIVYIFSEGIINNSLYVYNWNRISKKMEHGFPIGSIVGKLINTINILNKSGASMFLINPGRVVSEFGLAGGKMSLKIISRNTGGEYFEGSKIKTIVENVKKRTDAYYELFFNINRTKNRKKVDKVRIVSRNRDLKIYSPKSSVAKKKYGDLSSFEKKLKVIGLIEGNKWNYVDDNILNRRYKRKIKSGKISLNVKIPKDLSKMYCDIYKIKLKKNSREPEIIKVSKNLSEKEVIVFDSVSDELLFFVIISKHSHKSIVGRVE